MTPGLNPAQVFDLLALMIEAKRDAEGLPEESDQRHARFTEYVNYEHRLRQLDPAQLRAHAATLVDQETECEQLRGVEVALDKWFPDWRSQVTQEDWEEHTYLRSKTPDMAVPCICEIRATLMAHVKAQRVGSL